MTVLPHLRRRRAAADAPSGAPARPREAIVLSGGGSHGAAQVGAVRALLEAGVRPDLFVGCSVGALNAAFLAVDPSPARAVELEGVWRSLGGRDLFGTSRRSIASHLVRRDAHLYEPDGLRTLVRRWVPLADLADTTVPCHVVTTDLLAGQACWWSSGDPVAVLSASACLPAVFPPVPLAGSLHVDGGVTCPVPVERALDLGATRVWVVDVSGGSIGRRDERMTALDVLLLSFSISRQHLDRSAHLDRPGQTVVRLPRCDVGRLEMRDFSRTDELVAAGYAGARGAVARELELRPTG